ncbi:MAG: hypothetical protein ACU0AU_12775 [Cognatishimia activa]
MAIAIASGKVGYVLMRGDHLIDWKISRAAAETPEKMRDVVTHWLTQNSPELVVTERINAYSRKSDSTHALIAAAQDAIECAGLKHTAKLRRQSHANKYDEIAHLAERFPAIAPWAPERRKFYDPEPLNTILFEALSLAVQD